MDSLQGFDVLLARSRSTRPARQMMHELRRWSSCCCTKSAFTNSNIGLADMTCGLFLGALPRHCVRTLTDSRGRCSRGGSLLCIFNLWRMRVRQRNRRLFGRVRIHLNMSRRTVLTSPSFSSVMAQKIAWGRCWVHGSTGHAFCFHAACHVFLLCLGWGMLNIRASSIRNPFA